ncbi:hypothetical protein CesoFtcFv8_026012 [Champsocephalus esox]|nr:hypothetical protein CesoFtcFv8_026012 [Champsocephalus esox]
MEDGGIFSGHSKHCTLHLQCSGARSTVIGHRIGDREGPSIHHCPPLHSSLSAPSNANSDQSLPHFPFSPPSAFAPPSSTSVPLLLPLLPLLPLLIKVGPRQ